MPRYDEFDDDDRDVRKVEPPPHPWILLLVLAAVGVALAGGMAWMFVARTHAAEEARAAMRAEAARAEEAKAAMELQQAQRDVAAAKLAAMRAQQAELAAKQAVPGFNGGDAGQPAGKK